MGVAVSRALAIGMGVMLLDETASAPPLGEVRDVMKWRADDRMIIVVTHEMTFAARAADEPGLNG